MMCNVNINMQFSIICQCKKDMSLMYILTRVKYFVVQMYGADSAADAWGYF